MTPNPQANFTAVFTEKTLEESAEDENPVLVKRIGIAGVCEENQRGLHWFFQSAPFHILVIALVSLKMVPYVISLKLKKHVRLSCFKDR